MSKRRRAREMAVQMLYQSDLGRTPAIQIIASFKPVDYVVEESTSEEPTTARKNRSASPGDLAELDSAFEYAKNLVQGTLGHLAEIDALIRKQAEHWRLERMPAVDRNILRLAVFELMFETDVPKLVVIDEAIELAKEYGSEQSGRFVNGVLDGLLKHHEFPGSLK